MYPVPKIARLRDVFACNTTRRRSSSQTAQISTDRYNTFLLSYADAKLMLSITFGGAATVTKMAATKACLLV